MIRGFLTFVALAYLGLAIWCVVAPRSTAASLGLTLVPGSGDSEYMVVYGGLQVALGLLFLWPWLNQQQSRPMLSACALIHGCLVAFRTASYLRFSGIAATTHVMAALEWAIFLFTLGLIWFVPQVEEPHYRRGS